MNEKSNSPGGGKKELRPNVDLPPVAYRVLPAAELERIKPLWLELNRHHYESSRAFKDHFRGQTFEKRTKALFTNEKQLFIEIATDVKSTKPIGYCVSSIDNEHRGEIESLYVLLPYRTRGVGGRLVKDALQHLSDNGVHEVSVAVAAGNEDAFSFYGKFGFAPRMHILRLSRSADG